MSICFKNFYQIILARKLSFVVVGVFVALLLFPQIATAATSTSNGIILDTLRIFGANMGLPETDPRLIIARLIRVAMGFVGIILLLMLLSSGAQFMISGGNEDKVKSAKKTFYNAIVGLIIILSAYSIVAFVLRSLSDANS